jgi:hypothetical protein
MASAKAEQIVDHFTQDQELKGRILELIDEVLANPGKHNFDSCIARFTDDPQLAATIKENFQMMKAGRPTQAIAEHHFGAGEQASHASDTMAKHWGAVEHILQS